jgi:hypothetical protein
MSRDDRIEEHVEAEDDNFVLDNVPSYICPRIFEGNWQEDIPAGFDAITLSLDGRLQSDLNWKKVREQARQAVEKGYALMWNMQIGLFTELAQPLASQSQFLSLTLALEHFRDSLWQEFKSQTLGLSLFRGSADFSKGFRWDEDQEQNLKNWLQDISAPHLATLDFIQLNMHGEGQQLVRLYCRDVAIEYLSLLATRLPDALPAYLYLDVASLSHSFLNEIQLLNPERFDRLHLALKGQRLPWNAWGWNVPTAHGYSGDDLIELPSIPMTTIGVCIPPMQFYHASHYQGLEEALMALHKKSIPFRLIAECHLTSQWDGLDYLLYCPAGLSTQGKRKLQGFCAAGGTVISIGDHLGLPYELQLKDWLQTL